MCIDCKENVEKSVFMLPSLPRSQKRRCCLDCVCVYMYVSMFMMYAYIGIHIYICVCVHACMNVTICVCLCVHILCTYKWTHMLM